MKNISIVIPARWASGRFPGKPMAMVAGKTLIRRVWENAKRVQGVSDVVIATDDDRIYRHALAFTVRVVMTRPECRNGTERVWDAVSKGALRPDICVNFQGDAPLTPPWVVESLITAMQERSGWSMTTPVVGLTAEQAQELARAQSKGIPGAVTAAVGADWRALYFSRSPIPFLRNTAFASAQTFAAYRHVGVYAYMVETLKELAALPPGRLEQTEELEQLRALEYGIPVYAVPVDYRGRTEWEVNSPEDVGIVEKIIKEQGEFT